MSPLTASLPMYNLPEMRAANAAFWKALSDEIVREGFAGLPDELAFSRPPVPDAIGAGTVFSQTCGYPLLNIFRGQYQMLGIPTYDAPGCGEGTHCAFILVRKESSFRALEDLRGATFALNSRHSNSGMNLPRLLFAKLAGGKPFFGKVVGETGGHLASMRLMEEGGADCASIDCLTYVFLQDHRPAFADGFRVLAQTPASPAIPFITAVETAPDRVAALRRALQRMSADPACRPVLAGLRLRSISPPDPETYRVLDDYERQAAELGYAELA